MKSLLPLLLAALTGVAAPAARSRWNRSWPITRSSTAARRWAMRPCRSSPNPAIGASTSTSAPSTA
ncbi:hypothetical protein [Lysobacter gummosus]|uniref:hypothetical protein n=1 Tax=Lysobacter gummosus TaxID=262324 RepID=UPI0036273139